MLSTETFLAVYYLGCGFVIFLLWGCVSDEADRAVEPAHRRRLHRLATASAVVGVLHPALALAGRDLAGQLGRADGPHDPRAAGTLRVTTWALAVAAGLAGLVVVSQIEPFDEVPLLRRIATGLPYE